MLRLLRGLWRDKRGSFVLESSVVLPLAFTAVLLLMLFSLLAYQRAIVYYSASTAAERAAFRWDNSYRDPLTGEAPAGQHDPLYWRLADDRLLEGIFGSLGGASNDAGGSVALPVVEAGSRADGLSSFKLRTAAAAVIESFSGEAMMRRDNPLLKQVAVELEAPLAVQAVNGMTGRGGTQAEAAAVIVDPVEFTRIVDLARYYAAKFGNGPGGAAKKGQAKALLEEKGKQGEAAP